MMKFYLIGIVALLLMSCNKKEAADAKELPTPEVQQASETKKFEMYSMSEMSLLMEQMYIDNERLKARIQKGDTIGQFPNHFLQIHKAVMADDTENDAFFKDQAAQFINAQKLIYADPENAKKHFNSGIDACVKCHEVKCGGPIPRIKKLYIK